MTVKELVKRLSSLKEDLQDKKVVVMTQNGLLVEPDIRFILKEQYKNNPLEAGLTKESVDMILLY